MLVSSCIIFVYMNAAEGQVIRWLEESNIPLMTAQSGQISSRGAFFAIRIQADDFVFLCLGSRALLFVLVH